MKLITRSVTDEVIDEKLDLDSDIITRAQTSDSSAQLEVGKAYCHTTHIQGNCLKAFKWIESSAKQGNMEAQFRLGDMFALGHGVDQNIRIAHDWYTKSALQDYSKALIRIHNLYEEDKKIHCRGELNSEEEGQNELAFKLKNNVRELNEYRLNWMQSKNLLGNTVEYFSELFKSLKESKDDDKDAQHKLGFLYQHGYGVRKIAKRAIECYTKAAELGHVGAQYNLGLLYQENHDIKFNYRHAFEWYTKAAEGGSTPAQNRLAYFYEKGLVIEVDYSKALYWYTQAAKNNNKGAMLNIARIYRKGLIDKKTDYVEAIKWYIMAAKQGSSVAKNCLHQLSQRTDIAGINAIADEALLDNESSIKRRLCSKLRLDISNLTHSSNFNQLKELASHALVGDGNAMFELGYKYLEGKEFSPARETGVIWIKKAAQSGLIKAQLYLARVYEEGITDIVKQDYYEASIWYSKAAKTKNIEAQNKIGLLYYQGHGLRKDPLEASKWFTWSTDQGNSGGQYMLEVLRQRGEGLREDSLESYEWFEKSASQGNPYALYQISILYMEGKVLPDKKSIIKNPERALKMHKYAAHNGSIDAQLSLAKMCEKENGHVGPFYYYLMAAKNGNAEAKYKIGHMYLHGKGVEQSYREAFKWISCSAKNNYEEAKSIFDTPIETLDKSIEYYKLLEMFKVATQSKEASLEYNIGYIYEKGLGNHSSRNYIKPNPSEAIFWYEQAEKKENSKALYRLGKMYQEDKGILRDNSVALYYFKKAAKLKNIDSLNTLALIYLGGVKVQEDSQEAFRLYQEAANFGCPNARSVLALLYETEKKDNGGYLNVRIKNMWEQAAAEGNVAMQYQIGVYYLSRGYIESAIKWLGLAAQEKFTEAYYKLGEIYEEEIDYQDYSKAIKMYEAARGKKHDMAIYRLARLYQYGSGVPRDYDRAFLLYAEAATYGNTIAYETLDITKVDENNTTSKEFKSALTMCEYVAQCGNIDFQYKVGYVYEKITSPREYNKAHKWYSMASSNSHKEAAYRLGLLYKSGLGCSQNWLEAIKYFEKAMDLGSSEACFELGEVYYSGNGVDIDKLRAKHYYLEAAKHGDPNAQYTLGKLFEEGYIVKKNLLESLKWYTKAYYQENEKAIERLHFLDIGRGYEEFFEEELRNILEMFADRYKNTKNLIKTRNDLEFYGYVYFRLGCMYFYRAGKDSLKKTWGYFNIANKDLKNKDALLFIDCVDDAINEPDKDTYCQKLKMFYEVIDDIDRKQLYKIGMLYYNGKKLDDDRNIYAVEPNYELAFEFFKKSLDKGLLKSRKQLGDMYYYGTGVPADHKEGQKHHIDWANTQNGNENFQTGQLYYENINSIEENKHIAFIYMTKASNQKNLTAQEYLNRIFHSNQQTSEYYSKAVKIHKIFADIQNTEENLDAGRLYYEGNSEINKDHSIAEIYFTKANNNGNAIAQQYLGDMYYHGDVEKNHGEAIRLHNLSANQRTGSNCFEIGQDYYKGTTLVIQNPEIALIYVTKAAEKDTKYQRYLADMYYYGEGVDEDQTQAVRLHELSANKLDSKELFAIGREYYEGSKDIKKNYSIGLIYLNKAIIQGSPEAASYLRDVCYYGDGVEKDNAEANRLHELSASKLKSEENFAIGREYYEGSENVKKNRFIGLIYLNKALNQKSPEAERYLGDAYYYGEGVEKDEVKAYQLHKIAANHSKSEVNFKVAKEYYSGTEKVKQNYSTAFIYFTRVDSNNVEATRHLGDMYFHGNGVKKDEKRGAELHKTVASLCERLQNLETGLQYLKDYDNINGKKFKKKDNRKSNFVGFLYITEAWNQQFPEAGRYLADMYQYGIGTEVDQTKATKFYESSADQFGSRRNFEIGRSYYEGSDNIKMNRSAGFVYLTKAVDQGSSDATRYLGDKYYYGDGVEKDQEKSSKLHISLANKSSPGRNFAMGREYCEGLNGSKVNFSTGLIYLTEAASKNHPNTQKYMGDLYYYGVNVEENKLKAQEYYGAKVVEDKMKAREFYKLSANSFSANENHRIGEEYYKGLENVQKNPSIAAIYFTAAAEQRHSRSQRYLGDMYYYGEGVEKDYENAINLYKYSAKGSTIYDSVAFGLDYYRGPVNTKKNYDVAFIYFSRASGVDTRATRYLGDMYYNGTGVEKNEETAFELYNSFPSRSSRAEDFKIGQEYLRGSKDTNKNYSIAFIYLKKSFNQGSGFAAQHLGDMYLYGNGVEQNINEAMEMFTASSNLLLKSECFEIGQEYFHGSKNVKKNDQIARIYLTKAANGGVPGAIRYLKKIQDKIAA